MIQATIHTEDFREACETGRGTKQLVDLGWEEPITIYCMHGVGGGIPEARRTTDLIVAAARIKIRHDPCGPKLLVGDIDVVPRSMLAIKEMIDEDQWTDVGRKSHWCGRETNKTTCQNNSKTKATRIDAILVNPQAPTIIHDFGVDRLDGFPTHSIIRIKLSRRSIRQERFLPGVCPR